MEHDFSTGQFNNTKVSVAATSTTVLSHRSSRKYAVIVNDSNETIYLGVGEAAVLNEGIRLNANGGAWEIKGGHPYQGVIYAISTSGSKNVTVFEAY